MKTFYYLPHTLCTCNLLKACIMHIYGSDMWCDYVLQVPTTQAAAGSKKIKFDCMPLIVSNRSCCCLFKWFAIFLSRTMNQLNLNHTYYAINNNKCF